MTGDPLADFQAKFRTAELLVREFDHWLWTVRAVQSTLGAGVLSLKRYTAHFGDVNSEEGAELSLATRTIEGTLARIWRPDKMNYLMLMMVDPHVHFHVMPRYAEPRSFAGTEWSDDGWPGIPVVGGDAADGEILARILEAIRGVH